MSSRKVCTPVLVIALSLGTLPELNALPLQGAREENRVQQALSNRIFQEMLDFLYDLRAAHHMPPDGSKAPEGSGICPNGKPPGRQGSTGSTGNNGNNGNNGNG